MWFLTFQMTEVSGNAKNMDQTFYKQKVNGSCEEAVYHGD